MNRALPSWAIDLIRNGLPTAQLHVSGGDKAIWAALYRLSLSANQRGWDAMELRAEIEHGSSRLGHQIKTKDGARERSDKAITSLFANTWDRAHEWLSTREQAWDADEQRDAIERRAKLADQIAADADLPLLDSDRAVLAFAADEMRRRCMAKVVLPWRAVAEATGLGQRSVQNALARLVKCEVLVIAAPGRPTRRSAVAGAVVPGRATVYAVLPREGRHPYLCPVNGAYGTPAVPTPRPMGPPSSDELGPLAKTYGTPSVETPAETTGEDVVDLMTDRITITGSAEEVARLLELVRANGLHVEMPAGRPELRVVRGEER